MCNHNQGERRTERRLACDCEGPIKSDCLNAIFISMAIEFLHNLAKQRLRPPARPPAPYPSVVRRLVRECVEYGSLSSRVGFCSKMTGCNLTT